MKMKALLKQVQIIKISTSRLKRANWDLKASYAELIARDELIRVSNSQLYRWLKTEDYYAYNDNIVAVVAESVVDFNRACSKKGFKINDIEYVRLLGTTGGVKSNTVLFIRKDRYEEIHNKIENGRHTDVKLVPAKYEAYRALVATGSIPLTKPKHPIVVKDIETTFKDEVILVDGSNTTKEDNRPTMKRVKDYEITLDANDGFGLVSPALMKQWSLDIKERTEDEDYICGGICLRNAFLKGMVFPFDYVKFAEEVAHTYEITDIYGDVHDIREVDLVITESQLKLWSAYDSMEEYLENCEKNGYDFCACKVSERELEDTRRLNYQYLQSYELSDEDIKELCQPTLDWIAECSGGDYLKVLAFLGASEEKGFKDTQVFIRAIQANPEILKDRWIREKVNKLLIKKKDEAKIGKLICEGNYQIIGGDPYALCQGMFGLKITGLLKPNEIYNSYWSEKEVDEVLLFRSPMTNHNNIRRVKIDASEECKKWFKYINNIVLLSAFDTITIALNGAD